MSIDIIFLLDGLTNQQGVSGEIILERDIAKRINLPISWYNYNPATRDGRIVETIEVYPFFFGLPLIYNPGRAGLEFLLDGDDISENNVFVVIRSNDPNKVIFELRRNGINARLSNYSRDKRTVIVSTQDKYKDRLRNYLIINHDLFIRVSHENYLPVSWYNKLLGYKLNGSYRLIGYCEGGLLSAMKLCGIETYEKKNQIIPMECKLSYKSYLIETTFLDRVKSSISDRKIPIVYLKNFAYDARKGVSKEISSENVSGIISDVISEISKNKTFETGLIISDHNSEVGIDETLPGMTKIGVIGNNKLFEDYNDGCEQWELINYLKMKGVLK